MVDVPEPWDSPTSEITSRNQVVFRQAAVAPDAHTSVRLDVSMACGSPLSRDTPKLSLDIPGVSHSMLSHLLAGGRGKTVVGGQSRLFMLRGGLEWLASNPIRGT
jgi:hypothetical protein